MPRTKHFHIANCWRTPSAPGPSLSGEKTKQAKQRGIQRFLYNEVNVLRFAIGHEKKKRPNPTTRTDLADCFVFSSVHLSAFGRRLMTQRDATGRLSLSRYRRRKKTRRKEISTCIVSRPSIDTFQADTQCAVPARRLPRWASVPEPAGGATTEEVNPSSQTDRQCLVPWL